MYMQTEHLRPAWGEGGYPLPEELDSLSEHQAHRTR